MDPDFYAHTLRCQLQQAVASTHTGMALRVATVAGLAKCRLRPMRRSHLAPVDAAGKRALLHVELAAQEHDRSKTANSPAAAGGSAALTANGKSANGLTTGRPAFGSSHQLKDLMAAEQPAQRSI